MEVVLDRDAFLRGLQMVQNIVEPRQTLPILANVLVEAEGETVRLTATDLEVGARVGVPARVASPGAITVSARKLAEIVKELPAAAVALRVGENATVSLRCGGATYKLVGLAPDDFPAVVPATPASWVTLDARTLREMLAQTKFAVSHDETRYALNGILFTFQGKDVRLVATDGHRLAISMRSLGTGVGGASGIVPRKAVNELERVLGAGEDVQIAITDNQFVLQMPNFVMTARLIEGQFPNYEAVVPKNHPGKLVIGRSVLAAALRRVAVMAEERNKPVKLTLAPATLRLSASSQELGEAEEILEVEYAGEELTIGFNSRYVLDAISAVEKDQVVFEFKDGLSPGLIKTVEDEGYCCVIMPMRI
ncbi:MAG: DNA polymerase III subunit beta [Candidatus Rokubacteria bacterium RIFCSPHIGHO2_12_FULL_73_22]|nr:MAG: DNA polymerase III subunit beta [Candidatus Rokubacteria bacterium RIFCSPHIGHO2_02_FULL_73_26]OGL01626.1 MAG: DNA polymerase III subunit beta [Candidatus Rokubacteria bacterium RIFCSPHIGHO2_12_FULL_73_22]OGL13204.1 MAG: DNA polymerase III subunit beta [Candidatus Rokubacteria bacterium RIFCSPLOWO2_02_FULL_73_56]OGL29401.1 MAG: DNA polymerase III subunit beta [Candidatus Rokubacteria bacterium RIFCSPLOWO2_12_FULL_73_47]